MERFAFKFIAIFGLMFIGAISYAQSQSCESEQIALVQAGRTICQNQAGTCGVNIYGPTEFQILNLDNQNYFVRCAKYRCSDGIIEYSSGVGYSKCSSQQGLFSSKAAQNIFDSNLICGSIVQTENGVLGESVPIVGTNFTMNYFTSWVEGRTGDYKARASLAEAQLASANYTVPVTYDYKLQISGLTVFTDTNIVTPTISHLWDGLDQNGNPTLGTVMAKGTITSHLEAGDLDLANDFSIGSLKSKYLGLGGWLPSNYYFYDSNSKRLFSGDGSIQSVKVRSWNSTGYYLAIDEASKVLYFDQTGRIQEIKTALLGTTVVSYQYSTNGYLLSITEPFGRVTYFNRDSGDKITSITAPNGKITTIALSTDGYISSITNPLNQSYDLTYHGNKGLLATFSKPGGQISTFTYDSDGNLIKDLHSGGFFYDLVGTLSGPGYNSEYTTPMNRKTRQNGSSSETYSEYKTTHPTGMVSVLKRYTNGIEQGGFGATIYTSVIDDPRFGDAGKFTERVTVRDDGRWGVVDSQSRSAQLSSSSDPFSIISLSIVNHKDPNFNATTSFNPATNVLSTITDGGKTSSVTIDLYERPVSAQVGNQNAITYNYTNQNLMSIVHGTRTTSMAYNSTTGYLESVTNPLNQTTLFSYDSAGQLVGQVSPDLRAVTYSRDSNGNISGITPFGKPTHYFTLNANELSSGYQPPPLTGVTNVNTSYTYNLDKQLTRVDRPDGTAIEYNYNSITGKLESMVTPSGTYQIDMDSDYRVVKIVSPNGYSVANSYARYEIRSYEYRNPSYYKEYKFERKFKDSGLIDYEYIENGSGSQSSQVYFSYNNDQDLTRSGEIDLSYNTPNGQLTGTTLGSGASIVTDSYTYNNYGEMTGYKASYGSTVIYQLDLTRDGMGRISGKDQTMNSTTDNFIYGFDISGRLEQVTKNTSVASNYGYDSNSNRNSGNVGAQTTSATYDDQDRLLTYNTLSFTYNANGDLQTKTNSTTSTTTQYTYDVFGNLIQVVLPGATTITYEIDGMNRRIGRSVNGVLQKRWVYSDQYRIAAEMDSSGNITKRFVYGSKGNIPDYFIAGGEKYRIISDQLGSPRLVVKVSDGTIIQRMDHDEFGRVTEDTNPGYLPFGFAGGLYDSQTSLVRFGARDYDPEIGRWTSKDPIDFEGGEVNLFGYVANDPINWIDIEGLTKSKVGQVLEKDPFAGGGAGSTGRVGGGEVCGRNGSPIKIQKGTNSPATIDGVKYTGHALDQMQGRGIPPSAVKNTLNVGGTSPARNGAVRVYDSGNNISVIVNPDGTIKTVIPGK